MNKHIGQIVREARERHQLDQGELAQLLGIPRTSLCKTETGQRSLSAVELITLAQLFGEGFEHAIENRVSDILADLAARLRTMLETVRFGPTAYVKRDWLRARLEQLDHSYAAA